MVGVIPGWELLPFGAEGRGARAECCLNRSVRGKSGVGAGKGGLRENTG